MQNNNKGIALLSTLLLGTIAVVIVAAFLYVLTRGTTISRQEKLYTSALEAAKGVAFVILKEIKDGNLMCGTVSCTDPSVSYPANINLNIGGKDFSNLGGFSISAQLLSYRHTAISDIYSVRVISRSTGGNNTKAEITFVVELE